MSSQEIFLKNVAFVQLTPCCPGQRQVQNWILKFKFFLQNNVSRWKNRYGRKNRSKVTLQGIHRVKTVHCARVFSNKIRIYYMLSSWDVVSDTTTSVYGKIRCPAFRVVPRVWLRIKQNKNISQLVKKFICIRIF